MDKSEALKHIDTLLKVALGSDDIETVHRVLQEARKLIAKAITLPA